MTEFDHVTTDAVVVSYQTTSVVFAGLFSEVRELSKKKPEGTMSTGKVKIINRVLDDLITFLKSEPEGKYLDKLDDGSLPQMSDAVLVMVQYETALEEFRKRYFDHDYDDWITEEFVSELDAGADEAEESQDERHGDE